MCLQYLWEFSSVKNSRTVTLYFEDINAKYVRAAKIYFISNESARAPEWPISDVVCDILLKYYYKYLCKAPFLNFPKIIKVVK